MRDTRGHSVQPLTSLRAGQAGTVASLGGGRHFMARLIAMGLHVGTGIRVLSSPNGSPGPTLVAAGDTRLAIGHGMAERIMIRTESVARPPEKDRP
jgi:ferrous iron transport protein A